MKLPLALENLGARFDSRNLRERALIAIAALAAIVMIWDTLFMQPLNARQVRHTAELATLQKTISVAVATAEASTLADPMTAALNRQASIQNSLDAVNKELSSASAGLVPPERMTELINDVLSRQRNLKLVTLHNEPVRSLIKSDARSAEIGPFIHPVELVVEGRYLDILDYLHGLEALPWRFRWKVLELQTIEYPVNRVRIELSTMSMEKEWLGV